MRSVIRHDVTGSTTEQETVQLPAANVQGGPPVPASSVTSPTQPYRTSCGWCKALMVDGPLSPEGLESTGICPECRDREIARIREAAAHNLPLYIHRQEPAGTYRVEDRQGRMLARNLPGSGIASAMAVKLEELTKSGDGWCPRHVPTLLREGRCFACALGHEPSPWSVAK